MIFGGCRNHSDRTVYGSALERTQERQCWGRWWVWKPGAKESYDVFGAKLESWILQYTLW